MIVKPEGYDLRDRRSDKSRSAADWLPVDALYSASTDVGDATCLFVGWRGRDGVFRFRASGTIEQVDSLLLRAVTSRRDE
jgi:hypothetical protein